LAFLHFSCCLFILLSSQLNEEIVLWTEKCKESITSLEHCRRENTTQEAKHKAALAAQVFIHHVFTVMR
jgi:hypothetical protein